MTSLEGKDDRELGHVVLDDVKSKYGFAHAVGHRSSLASALYDGCKREQGIEIVFATSITAIHTFTDKPRFQATPRDGSPAYEVTADVLLAADGVKSLIRECMLHDLDVDAQIEETGQAAYRIMLTREQLQDDPELLQLLDANTVTRWVGVKKHLIAYPVAGKSIYNISTIQPDKNFAAAPSATYTTRGSKKAMLDTFSEFCPRVQRLLNLVPEGEVCEWRLRMHSKLPTWVYGSVALVGDACHPTLPHLAQGAAQAIEDGAVLAVVLASLPDTTPETINWALRSYEEVRKTRAETLVDLAAASGRALHLDESDAKAERDRQFAALKEGKGPSPDKWADGDVLKMINGFDCVRATEELMAKGGAVG